MAELNKKKGFKRKRNELSPLTAKDAENIRGIKEFFKSNSDNGIIFSGFFNTFFYISLRSHAKEAATSEAIS